MMTWASVAYDIVSIPLPIWCSKRFFRAAHKPLNENLMKIVFNLETLTLLFSVSASHDKAFQHHLFIRWTEFIWCFISMDTAVLFEIDSASESETEKKGTEKEKVAKATQLSFAVWHLWEFKDYCYFIIICLVLLVDSSRQLGGSVDIHWAPG